METETFLRFRFLCFSLSFCTLLHAKRTTKNISSCPASSQHTACKKQKIRKKRRKRLREVEFRQSQELAQLFGQRRKAAAAEGDLLLFFQRRNLGGNQCDRIARGAAAPCGRRRTRESAAAQPRRLRNHHGRGTKEYSAPAPRGCLRAARGARRRTRKRRLRSP